MSSHQSEQLDQETSGASKWKVTKNVLIVLTVITVVAFLIWGLVRMFHKEIEESMDTTSTDRLNLI